MTCLRTCTLAVVLGLLFAANAGTAVAQDQNLEEFSMAVNGAADEVAALQGLTDLTAESVTIVSTSDLTPQEEVAGLVEAATADPATQEQLHAALGANEAIVGALEANQQSVEDVVAVHVSDDNQVKLYARTE